MSFSKAADELCLTQGAVSHRIRMLESELGFALFHRFTRRIAFTEEGARLHGVLNKTISEIESELRAIHSQELHGSLNIFAPPSFAACWLVPRLTEFQQRYPGINLNLRSRTELVDFETERVHLAVHYGSGRYPGMHVIPLLDENIFPVCSPEYARENGLGGHPSTLSGCTLLHDAQPWPNGQYFSEWKFWLDGVEMADFDFQKGSSFDRSVLALEVAACGGGVAMGRSRLVREFMRSGRLVMPFDTIITVPHVYSVVMPQEYARVSRVQAFCTWMREQALKEEFF